MKRNLRLTLVALCLLAGLARAAQESIAGALASASGRFLRNRIEKELSEKLTQTPGYAAKCIKNEDIETFVEGLSNKELRTINNLPVDCSPGWWPVVDVKSLQSLYKFAEKMSNQFPKVNGEMTNTISCNVKGWGCDRYPKTRLTFQNRGGKVLCTAKCTKVVGNYDLSTKVTEITDIPVVKVEHVKDQHYQMTLDKYGWKTLDITIPLATRRSGEKKWEKVLNFIRNTDPTIVRCRPQTRPRPTTYSLGASLQ